jgi:hypothetical protein
MSYKKRYRKIEIHIVVVISLFYILKDTYGDKNTQTFRFCLAPIFSFHQSPFYTKNVPERKEYLPLSSLALSIELL